MGKYRIRFDIADISNLIAEERFLAIANKLLFHKFGSYKFMNLNLNDSNGHDIPYNHDFFIANLLNTKTTWAHLSGDRIPDTLESNLQCGIKKSIDSSYFTLMVDREDFIDIQGVNFFYEVFLSVSKLMPNLSYAKCGPTSISDYYKKINMKTMGEPHGRYLDWVHILGPSKYTPFYTKEDLLNAPAYKVEEWDNNVIFMMCIEDPFTFDVPSNITQTRIITDYLRSKTIKEKIS